MMIRHHTTQICIYINIYSLVENQNSFVVHQQNVHVQIRRGYSSDNFDIKNCFDQVFNISWTVALGRLLPIICSLNCDCKCCNDGGQHCQFLSSHLFRGKFYCPIWCPNPFSALLMTRYHLGYQSAKYRIQYPTIVGVLFGCYWQRSTYTVVSV